MDPEKHDKPIYYFSGLGVNSNLFLRTSLCFSSLRYFNGFRNRIWLLELTTLDGKT